MKREYINGNLRVSIDLSDGTKERFTEDDEFHPQFAESMDVTITSKCDGLCQMCYAGCTPSGTHANLMSDYVVDKFIPSLKPYTELALNGNDLSHPQLQNFLRMLKEHSIIANLTVNQRHFMQNIDLLHHWYDIGLIHGLGVSLDNSSDENFISEIKKFPNAVIHVIAGIFSPDDIKNLQDKDLKILILGYKRKERGIDFYEKNEPKINMMIAILNNLLPSMINLGKFKVISFDNLAIEQLHIKEMMDPVKWEEFYMGDDGSFTFYVDLVNKTFARDSLSTNVYDISDRDAQEMFKFIQGVR